MQQQHQPCAVNALGGVRRVRAEDVDGSPAECGRLRAPIAEEPIGIGDRLPPVVGPNTRGTGHGLQALESFHPYAWYVFDRFVASLGWRVPVVPVRNKITGTLRPAEILDTSRTPRTSR
jgi:hypothetical protein